LVDLAGSEKISKTGSEGKKYNIRKIIRRGLEN
jgi:hypothetical protein